MSRMSRMSNLKVGDTVKMLYAMAGFSKGQVLEVYRLEEDGRHLLKGSNYWYNHCDGEDGAYVPRHMYVKLNTATPHTVMAHPHADLMLKYAQIAQYDDKPWEHFEFSDTGTVWCPCTQETAFYPHLMYRLKPQTPVVQECQTWVSLNNGQEVQVFRKPYPSEGGCGDVKKWVVGVVLDESINLVATRVISELDLIRHFKLKK